MSTMVHEHESTSRIRVALVIESGKLKPVWFEESGRNPRERIFVKEICYTWTHMDGAAKIISFAVWDGTNTFRLSLNTRDFTWKLGVVAGSER